MKIGEIKKTYDVPGKRWGQSTLPVTLAGKRALRTPERTFDEMLREAEIHADLIDFVSSKRVSQ